ncbi:hypothetical protein G647_06461 [Cladophialophora carrionii CBS 160.54]|uniref:Uncharacterized protein n=1 Tax=Cladophialophora carrionii CBS 160.54 TaxID=1279043 RepID=V9D8V4_9EURO|nr:uncharacterized protein G647_06461 [Cladophialophora carrionii CBS 160.54]ETI22387.1 hypothetical protein G647_06461 [Cladophialophora carrionii CBS 160.54]
MQPATDKHGTVSAKSLFSRPARTSVDRQSIVPPRVTKPRRSLPSEQRDSSQFYGKRQNDPRVSLADKFIETLDRYGETLHDRSANDLEETERKLSSNLEELALDVEAHCHKLSEIEEPLQKPITTEALTNVRSAGKGAVAGTEEVLLKESISEFRKLNEEKGQILRQLWEEWEDVQLQIMSLAVELYGKDSLHVVQMETGTLKPGQLERLHDMFKVAKTGYHEMRRNHAELQRSLDGFEEDLGQISNKAKNVAKEIHESYVQKKTENMKQITNLLQQFTED